MPHEIANPTDLSTRELLAELIRHAVLAEAEVRFFTPRGEGKAAMQRVRMELSRRRQRNERKGKKNLRFSLHPSIYPWTPLDEKRAEPLGRATWLEGECQYVWIKVVGG